MNIRSFMDAARLMVGLLTLASAPEAYGQRVNANSSRNPFALMMENSPRRPSPSRPSPPRNRMPDFTKLREQLNLGQDVRTIRPRPSSSSSGINWGQVITDAFKNFPQTTSHPRGYPQNNFFPPPRSTRQPIVRPQAVIRPQPVLVAPAPSRPVAPPQNVLVPPASPPKNNPSLALTDVQEQAAAKTAEEADELAATAEEQLLNDPELLKGKINAVRDVKAALEKFKQTGDASDLEKIKNDPNTPPSVKDKIDIVIAATEASQLIREGGLNANGTEALIKKLKDKIANSGNRTPADRQQLQDAADQLQLANDNRKLIDQLAGTGLGGGLGSGGTQTGLPPDVDLAMLDPEGPLFAEEPLNDVTGAAITRGTLLLNPEENSESVRYVLANRQYTMRPGESQWLETTYEITFHRGGQFGTARYSLPPGTYEFVVTDRGWDLKRRTYEVTIDNSRYPGSFGYMVGTQQFTLQPGERRSHQSEYPLVVVFDRGDGGEPARKRLRSGTYQVGIDVHHARLDLFPATQPSSLLSGAFSDDPALSLGAEDLIPADANLFRIGE